MADKSVGELIAAQSVTPTDLFVLEQNGTAKKLTGQVLENWLVSFADGHGGIQSIGKVSSSGLTDTYRITLADTTTFDFVVTNGRGVTSVSKTGTSGLADTYRISYNDGSYDTFTVTNGAKGDKGDNTYVWIKYASQEPTASSHSFGDIPDNWIGIYAGGSAVAPADWQQYDWFQIKGEKGDTGAPATLASSQITYQAGDSGTVIPSGAWSTTIPTVAQGKYLWTRQVIQFNTGSAITSYSVSRFGIDGTGAVSTVAGVSPDANGNVALTASDVKALSVQGGTVEGSINMNGQKLTGLNAPTADDEAATRKFVETYVAENASMELPLGVEYGGTGATNAEDARKNLGITPDGIGALSMELLWNNAKPGEAFTAQNIPLDLSRYKFVGIAYTNAGMVAINHEFPINICKVGKKIMISQITAGVNGVANAASFASRQADVSEGGICFWDGYDVTISGATAAPRALVPQEVYGIKGVQV